jgi:hypothetical protein
VTVTVSGVQILVAVHISMLLVPVTLMMPIRMARPRDNTSRQMMNGRVGTRTCRRSGNRLPHARCTRIKHARRQMGRHRRWHRCPFHEILHSAGEAVPGICLLLYAPWHARSRRNSTQFYVSLSVSLEFATPTPTSSFSLPPPPPPLSGRVLCGTMASRGKLTVGAAAWLESVGTGWGTVNSAWTRLTEGTPRTVGAVTGTGERPDDSTRAPQSQHPTH